MGLVQDPGRRRQDPNAASLRLRTVRYRRTLHGNDRPEGREKLGEAVSEEGFRDEFVGEISEHLIERISPDLWNLSGLLMREPQRREIMIGLMEGLRENLDWFPTYQDICARTGRRR